ncbi:uncharacterized protein LOC112520383 [Cynara cardunculus var. scolymus]|uniref:uncharacterized protein LOC112520383 n=1 Tax=Cynara cardunculus var. scolymus TaxID=59895 RepID=UPI000D62E37C|nr:uncharacterized protein LOC112520383 [Cynara cardunculus var. scolymus]
MQSVRSALLNLRKADFGGSISSSLPRHVSGCCFSSASNYSHQGKHASEETDNSYNIDEAISYVGDGSSELPRKAKVRIGEETANRDEGMKDESKERAHDMKQSSTSIAADKAGEGINKAADMVKAATDKTVDAVDTVAVKAKETVKGAWEATKDAKQRVSGTSSFNVDHLWEDHTTKPEDDTEKHRHHTGKPEDHTGKPEDHTEGMMKSRKLEGH